VLIVETIAKIRLLYHVKKKSIKQISRELGVSRNTIRKALRENKSVLTYQRHSQPFPKLEQYQHQLDAWLKEDSRLPKSQRCTARRLYERLQGVGYEGAYDSVQRFVKRWQEEDGKITQNAFIPLSFSPGEAYQFDWSEEAVELGGVVQKVKVAHFRLCYSRLPFVIAYPRETQEMLFDAHEKAFSFWGGQLQRGIYDNMKTAVDTVFIGKERVFNRRFMQMMSHYLIEPVACTPAAGWEKGQVENQVGNIREWLFTPRLKLADFASLNAHLFNFCRELAKKRQHPEHKGLSLQAVFDQDERSALQPLCNPFEGYSERACNVSSTCLINLERNRYSVDSRYAYRAVSVRIYATRIVVVAANGKHIGEHERHFGRDKVVYNPWHYVPLLERKPGALRNGAPFKEWDLAPPLQQVRDYFSQRTGGDKQFVEVLLAIKDHGIEAVIVACELALNDNVISSDYIINLLNRLRPTPCISAIDTPDTLRLQCEPEANCRRYNTLLQGATHGLC
jgi:transposase